MFAIKTPLKNNVVVNYNVKSNLVTPIKMFLGLNGLEKKTFDFLINEVFKKFNDSSDPSYLSNRWLSKEFFKILTNKENAYYENIYNLFNSFYSKNPFAIEQRIKSVLYQFFKKYEDFSKQIETPERLEYTNQEGLSKAVEKFFVPLFNNFLVEKLIENKEYKNLKEIIVSTLRIEADKFLKKNDASYEMENNSSLLSWITTQFNYKWSQKLGITKTYDQFFKNKTSNQIVNILALNFVSALANEFRESLKQNTKSPLKQVILYYLLNDLIIQNKIAPIAKGTLSEGRLLVLALESNKNFNDPSSKLTQRLEIFLKRLSQTLSKFGFYWKTPEATNGLAINKESSYDWITNIDRTNSNYELRFTFHFETSYVGEEEGKNTHFFKIPLKLKISAFEQAKNIVNDFVDSIQWNNGYMEQTQWTEKDIVQWAFNNNFNEFKNLIIPNSLKKFPILKELNEQQWLGFSPTDLSAMDFSIIRTNEYSFVIKPIIEFSNDSEEIRASDSYNESNPLPYLGTNRIFFRLFQYPKIYTAIDQPIQVFDIEAKSSSQTLSIIELFHWKMIQKFPLLLNFQDWEEQERFFWVNEFLDEEGEFVENLRERNDLTKRSNLDVLYAFALELKNKFDLEYRSGFEISRFVNHKTSEDNILKNGYEFGFSFQDTQFRKNKIFSKSIFLSEMKVFGEIKKGLLKGTKGLDTIFREKLKYARPLPTIIQPKLEIDDDVPNNFIFTINNTKTSFDEIINTFKNFGFTNIKQSKVKWELEEGDTEYSNFVSISYEVEYHNFSTGENIIQEETFNLYLNFEGISAEDIQKGYDNIIENIPEKKKKDQSLLNQIDKTFASLKDQENIEWRNDVTKEEYSEVIKKAIELIAQYRPGEKIIKQIEEIYGNKVPSKIASKFGDAEYLQIFNKILDYKNNFSKKGIKKILENDHLLQFFRKQETDKIEDIILRTLEYSQETKYAYLGTSVGLAFLGILAGVNSLRRIRLGIKSKSTTTHYKKSKYISILSTFTSIIAICGSMALMLLFFIEKGGI